MKVTSSVTTISWIPSEAVQGTTKLPFSLGIAHYDPPPPDRLDRSRMTEALGRLRDEDRFRFANHLSAWIEVEGSRITGCGQDGFAMIGSTTMRVGKPVTVAAVAYSEIRPEPEVGDGWVRFRQSAGGRTGVPVPRRVNRPPFVQIAAPTAWTTLDLTIHHDGRSEISLAGASPFPRHWVYDDAGRLALKSGMIDFGRWYRTAFGKHSPWGDEDSATLAAEVETSLERQLSGLIMGGMAPRISDLGEGRVLVRQGDDGHELFLLLDGILTVEVDGVRVAEVGPGSVLGERAIFERGKRTCTLTASTPCKVATVNADQIDRDALDELRDGHRREEGEAMGR
jgi:hypothetical protein